MSKRIILTEEQFRDYIRHMVSENVYVNDVNTKRKTAQITYNTNSGRNMGSKNPFDYLKTDKMDQNNADTYEVTLKGGITCYNITSIKGDEVMHYFKHLWDNKPTTMKFKDQETNQSSEYELTMLKQEEDNFLRQFKQKVGFIVKYCIDKFKAKSSNINFNGISIYPVPSTSNFNNVMANKLQETGFYSIPVQTINSNLFLKDLRNLEKDEDFIEKNKDYYNSSFYANDKGNSKSVLTYLDNSLNKMQAIRKAKAYIPEINNLVQDILSQIANCKTGLKTDRNTNRIFANLAENYKRYYDLLLKCLYASEYYNTIDNKNSKVQFDFIATVKKYSKGASIEKRSDILWNWVKPYLRGQKSPVNGKPYTRIELQKWDEMPFEIKTFTNGERMGPKNIYNINNREEDMEMVQQELQKIKGTIFLIFDDNLSGGATLSDICYQCKQLGIDFIIPITFGEMNEKWTVNILPLTKPGGEKDNKKRHATWNY